VAVFAPDAIARGFIAQSEKIGLKKAINELAALILDQHLHGQIERILEAIKREYQVQFGQVEATVITAYPLSSELKKLLSSKVKQQTNAKTVILHEAIDRSLLGGVKLTAPGMELDVSLRSKLSKLKA
jgi:F-type H+-transporting ATPase subunit delta